MTPTARSPGVHVPTHPAETGSLRPYFFGSILTHTALIALAPFVFATSAPVPVLLDEPDGGGDDWPPTPEQVEPNIPEPAQDVPEPTPPPVEPETPDTMSEATPPPPVVTPPVATQRVVPPTPRKPNATRSTSTNGRPGSPTASGRPGPIGAGSGIQSPKPAYPYMARKMRLTGNGRVTAWTDPAGRVVRCEVSGLPGMLTEYTRQFVQENWRGPAGAQFTREIEYRLE